MNYSIPIIERFASDHIMDDKRRKATETICYYLDPTSVITNPFTARKKLYSAVQSLLISSDYRRILLYLPFEILQSASAKFKATYMAAWYSLLGVYDVRENFFEGDVFEVDARPNGKVERVVKCAHLTPWLIKYNFLSIDELMKIIQEHHDDVILLRSFKDTLDYMQDRMILPSTELRRLDEAIGIVPPRRKLPPTYISDARLKWLAHRQQDLSGRLLTPNAHLEGPFSPNFKTMRKDISRVVANLQDDEIILIGGSRLKGYGVADSDLDIYMLDALKADSELCPGSPHAVHIYFSSVWAGKNISKKTFVSQMSNITSAYRHSPARSQCIERLENSLLQYRLLHKGFQRVTGKMLFDTSSYSEMDGDCPFYDDSYRKIATMLYAKYVYVP
ncbi:hypothetical protein IIY66_02450 [Candidatus Saccharibacteria bacterium]|nr:hypothetical protein [Candidatus Saccharibacteria bacterium]